MAAFTRQRAHGLARSLSRGLPRVALAAALAAGVAACSRLPFYHLTAYPAVGLPPDRVVGPTGDTLWARTVGLVTLLSPDREPFDSAYVVLESAPQVHERLLGRPPSPVAAVMLLTWGGPEPRRPVLPDSFASRPVVWGWWVDGDTVAREGPVTGIAREPYDGRPLRRGRVTTVLRPSPLPDSVPTLVDPGEIFPVEFYVAQRWVDDDASRRGRLPVWLEAAIVSAIAEGTLRAPSALLDRGLRDAPPLDSLFRRTCGSTWRAVPGDPMPKFGQPSAVRPTRMAWGPWLQERCGRRLRIQAYSLLDFLVETAGPESIQAFVDDARLGRPVEATLARFPSLPSTREGLDDVWRRWVREREAGRPEGVRR